MKRLSLVLILTLASLQAAARDGGNSRFSIGGFYGMSFISPTDINNIASSQSTTPRLNSISSGTLYGGQFGVMFSPKFQFRVSYEVQNAKNPTNLTSPAVNNAGYELTQNEIWGSLNYFLFHTTKTYGYIGGSLGYPTYSHVTSTLSSKTEYDADKTLGYGGQLGLGLMLGKHFSIFAEGGYQYLVSGDIKTSSGTALTLSSGSKAKMNLSGVRALAGIGILF